MTSLPRELTVRAIGLAVTLLTLLACGGDGATPTGSKPGGGTVTPGAPASITILTGDGQTAAPGSALPVALSVLVKDASSVAVPGVAVHFVVDSGGGSLNTSTATTGADGVAMGGTWTLGATAGMTNVLSVSAGSVTPVRLHARAFDATARTLIKDVTVSTSGGTLTYTKPGDALNGLSVTVPTGAYPVPTSWTIVADSTIKVPLASGLSQVGPVLVIGNGLGMSNALMTLTMPMHVAADVVVAPFYFDPVSGTLEAIPLGGRTDSSTTLATGHFSVNEMVIPGSGGGGAGGSMRATSMAAARARLHASAIAGFGSVEVVWVTSPLYALSGTQASTFYPGVDDWEFANHGDYIGPNGDCEGMSITAMYYHYLFRANGGSSYLYHHYDLSVQNQWDNVQGIRFAGSVQGDVNERYKTLGTEFKNLKNNPLSGKTPVAELTANWVLLTLKVTRRPVLLALVAINEPAAHAVVAYSADFSVGTVLVSFADPNYPGNPNRSMQFDDHGLVAPVEAAVNADKSPTLYGAVYAINVSGELPLEKLESRWAEFTNRKSGNDRYPVTYRLETSSDAGATWKRLGPTDEIWTTKSTSPQFGFREVCEDCPAKVAGNGNVQNGELWNQEGSAKISAPGVLPVGVNSFTAVLKALSPFALDITGNPISGFLDAQPLTIRYQPLSITTSAGAPGQQSVLTLHVGVLALPTSTYTWKFTDVSGTTTSVVTGDSVVRRAFAPGLLNVVVDLADPVHGFLGSATTSIDVSSASIQFVIDGSWDPGKTPQNGSYSFAGVGGTRAAQPGSSTLDGIWLAHDLAADNTIGVLFAFIVPQGAAVTEGETFSKVAVGQSPVAGQFSMLLATNLADPAAPNSLQQVPVGTGSCRIDSITQLSDGTFVAHYSFSIDNGTGGTIKGSGVGWWK